MSERVEEIRRAWSVPFPQDYNLQRAGQDVGYLLTALAQAEREREEIKADRRDILAERARILGDLTAAQMEVERLKVDLNTASLAVLDCTPPWRAEMTTYIEQQQAERATDAAWKLVDEWDKEAFGWSPRTSPDRILLKYKITRLLVLWERAALEGRG